MGHVIGIDTTYTGNPVSFNAVNGGTMKSVVAPLTYSQDLHGYANPWPGGGGVNKFNIDAVEGTPDPTTGSNTTSPRILEFGKFYKGLRSDNYYYPGYASYTISGGVLTVTNTTNNAYGLAYTVKVNAGESITVSAVNTDSLVSVGYYDSDWNYLSGTTAYALPHTFTTPANANCAVVVFRAPANGTATYENIQIEQGSTATAFTPYSNICPITGLTGLSVYVGPTQDPDDATVYNVDWSAQVGTVYGGTLDVVTGVLTVDRAMYTFTGNEDFGIVSASQGFNYFRWYGSSFTNVVSGWNTYNNAIMSNYKVKNQLMYWYSGGVGEDNVAWTVKGSSGLCVRADQYADITSFKASLAGQTLCYLLATPITYQLTPKKITALIGQNYIWSSNNETLNAVLTAPATGFAGWLIKCVTNGTPVEIPLKYMRAETYTVTPDQRMEWSAERDVTGVLHRETVQNLPPKIEFNTPLMTNSEINALNSIIKSAFTNYLQRNITIQFYDPERDQYWEWDCYMPDVKYHIRNADTVNNVINYEELRYAFIGY